MSVYDKIIIEQLKKRKTMEIKEIFMDLHWKDGL